MLAEMDDCVCSQLVPNPQIERKVGRGRRKRRTMVNSLRLLRETARRLDPNKHVSKLYTSDRNVLNDLCRPITIKLAATVLRQGIEKFLEPGQLQSLVARFSVRIFRIVRYSGLQPSHQLCAVERTRFNLVSRHPQ